jgi:transposase
MLIAERAQNDRLRQIIKELQRHRFGRKRCGDPTFI